MLTSFLHAEARFVRRALLDRDVFSEFASGCFARVICSRFSRCDIDETFSITTHTTLTAMMTGAVPIAPKSLKIGIARDLGSWPRIPCPRRCPRSARHVATAVVGGEIPGRPIWETRFLLSLNKPRSHFILWMVWEPEFDEVCSPVCWMQRRNVNERDAACYLLRTWWTKERDESSEDSPWFNDVRAGDVVGFEVLEALINEIWPNGRFSETSNDMS